MRPLKLSTKPFCIGLPFGFLRWMRDLVVADRERVGRVEFLEHPAVAPRRKPAR
jgi:hypothetical protein